MNGGGYILLVEDEPVVQANNKKILQRHGYTLKQAFTLTQAREVIGQAPPRAIILDVLLPDGSGLELLNEIRKVSNVPVLMLTAMGTPPDIVRGLEAGGDDYLTKPYELSVFLVRVEALLRRASLIPEALQIGPLRLEPAVGKALLGGVDIALSQKEYLLLQQFVQHHEEILSAAFLCERAWGQILLDEDSSLKNITYRLRKKLEGSGYTINAARGEGYIFERE